MKKGKLLAMLIALSLVTAGCSLTKEELEMYVDEQASIQEQLQAKASGENTAGGSTAGESAAAGTEFIESLTAEEANPGMTADGIAYWGSRSKDMASETSKESGGEGDGGDSVEGSSAASQSTEQKPETSPRPTQTSAPEQTPAPTKTPEQTSTPEKTTAPTQTPTQTSAPEKTTAPTQAPAQTSAPEQTTAPTQAPEQTSAPEQTTAPTQAPAQTSAPAEKTPAEICAEQGHVLTMESSYIFYDSTCSRHGDRAFICTRCGLEMHEAISKKEHDWEIHVLDEGDCISPYSYERICKVCGHWDGFHDDYSECPNKHHWVTGSYPWFNEETLEWEEKTRTFCSRCNMDKPE